MKFVGQFRRLLFSFDSLIWSPTLYSKKSIQNFFQTVLTHDNSSFNSFKAMDGQKLQKYGPFNETVFNFFAFFKNLILPLNVQFSELDKLFDKHISILTWLKF